MAVTKTWVESTKKRIMAAQSSGALSGWQEQFLADILGRLQKQGEKLKLSDAQQLKLVEAFAAAGV